MNIGLYFVRLLSGRLRMRGKFKKQRSCRKGPGSDGRANDISHRNPPLNTDVGASGAYRHFWYRVIFLLLALNSLPAGDVMTDKENVVGERLKPR